MLTIDQIDRDKLTPMMQQYVAEKEKRPDCLIFYRLGDFFELFFDDAILASKELELALTGRDCGLDERAPMCGVPHHAANNYILRLVDRGYKVAIVEQVEDAAQAKGLVKREVVKVITPGTLTDQGFIDEHKYLYLASIFQKENNFGLAVCDITTGLFKTCEITFGATIPKLLDELAKYQPSEIICNQEFADSKTFQDILKRDSITMSVQAESVFQAESIKKYSDIIETEEEFNLWAAASAGLLDYIEQTQFQLPIEFGEITPYQPDEYMILDQNTRRNLELTETIRDRKRRGSLLWAIDRTQTSMGARLLRFWLEQPLLDINTINRRQNAIEVLLNEFIQRQDLRDNLKGIYDLERLSGRIALGQINARDLISLTTVLEKIKPLKKTLLAFDDPYLRSLNQQLKDLSDLTNLLKSAIADDPPLTIKEGNIIRSGYNEQVDAFRDASENSKQWILDFEKKARERTGIKSLKVGYNRVFGYYIDIRKTNLDSVPEEYIRRQTLTNSERYITEELKDMEDRILGSEQRLISLEYQLFCEIRTTTISYLSELKTNAEILSLIDVLSSLAELAEMENYCKPNLTNDYVLNISNGRHSVVEQTLDHGEFVPNDVLLDHDEHQVMILTGPNMSGKSTFMRQVSLIVLLAQIGSFVPANSAEIGITDRIFTRVGAADDLGAGQSTFMVEMSEVSHIMRNATDRSLLILDEIGRGTSTYDGLSIAWSVIEHVVDPNYTNARTLFATHYHELTDLADSTTGVFNCHISATENEGSIVFLHQIEPGCAGQSYGIEVAKLAGVPESIVERAREILFQLEKNNHGKRLIVKKTARPLDGQLDLFSAAQNFKQSNKVIEKLDNIDMDYVSPVDARNILEELIAESKGKR